MCLMVVLVVLGLLIGGGTYTPADISAWFSTNVSLCDHSAGETEAVVAYGTGIFDPAEWTLTVTLGEGRSSVEWRNQTAGSLAYVDYIHYDCGIPEGEIDRFYSPDGFSVILSNYDSYSRRQICKLDDVRLYEFDVQFQGSDYEMRYWVTPATQTRMLALDIVFLDSDHDAMESYARQLFPQIPSCEAVAP